MMIPMRPGYLKAANRLVDRVFDAIPDHPEILSFSSANELLEMDEEISKGLDLSFAQAQMALEKAQTIWRGNVLAELKESK